ncbi:eukaryotic translation initiation factor 3 subunit G [Aethina tumida]|uniref:eukaryotic translation initiation factor 3 subunit G n=1 Tax=Aethina tumida TaxID=116153 RepID=UPI00096B254C|nr:eukaryotic translation initiation factor 3 subunit G [Aethina tumida]XP_019869734.1 eukaryotic translation initiation factor 3 subunit G [Aethina tumida]
MSEKEMKSSWADEVELDSEPALPPPSVVHENGFKIVTEYKINEDNQKVKIVRTYKIERRLMSKTVAARKMWKKFGDSTNDGPGPNPASTTVGEEVFMQFLSNKEEDNKPEEDAFDKLKALGDKNIKCRTCNGDHWTSKCPYKDTILEGGKILDDKKTPAGVGGDPSKPGVSKYIPPGMRQKPVMQKKEEQTTLRIGNLSSNTTDEDLEDLVKPFGPISKIYLAKDKQNDCKGYAYVHYKFRSDAAEAIARLNGHGYDHLILAVDWSRPHTSNQ